MGYVFFSDINSTAISMACPHLWMLEGLKYSTGELPIKKLQTYVSGIQKN